MAGKGSKARPIINPEKYRSEYDRIFYKNNQAAKKIKRPKLLKNSQSV